MEIPPIEPEFTDDELKDGAHHTLTRILAAGASAAVVAAASVIVARHIREAGQEIDELKLKGDITNE